MVADCLVRRLPAPAFRGLDAGGRARLRFGRLDSLAPDYVRTLAAWRQRFLSHEQELDALGYDAAFRRTWDYYFSYCMAGFSTRLIDNYQLLLARPEGFSPRQ